MKKSYTLMLVLVLILSVSMVGASADSMSWTCTRPVEVTNLETKKVDTEYIHTATVKFTYTVHVNSNGTQYTGATHISQTTLPGVAAIGSPTSTSANFSAVTSNGNKTMVVRYSGFDVSMNFRLAASKLNGSTDANNYNYGNSANPYTFTNQSKSKAYTK